MAQFKGTQATKRYAQPSEKVSVKMQGGRMRVAHDIFDGSATGALAASDTVLMGVIPKNAKVYDCYADVTTAFASGTINIGWAASSGGAEASNPTGFFSALALNAVSRNRLAGGAAGLNKEFAEEVDVMLTAPGVVPALGILSVSVVYALD